MNALDEPILEIGSLGPFFRLCFGSLIQGLPFSLKAGVSIGDLLAFHNLSHLCGSLIL